MHPGFHVRSRPARLLLVSIGLAVLAAAVMSARSGPTASDMTVAVCDARSMTDARMAELSTQHFAASPAHGYVVNSTNVAAADTFLVTNYQFNGDHNLATSNDVVTITAGQSVMFKWVLGIHTSTSGQPDDFDAGSLWSFPVDNTHLETILTFPTPGTYPFHCLFHGLDFNMISYVVVTGATPTQATTWGRVKADYR